MVRRSEKVAKYNGSASDAENLALYYELSQCATATVSFSSALYELVQSNDTTAYEWIQDVRQERYPNS